MQGVLLCLLFPTAEKISKGYYDYRTVQLRQSGKELLIINGAII